METPYPLYAFSAKDPSILITRLADSYLGKGETDTIAKFIVEKYQGDELEKYLSKLLMQAYIEIKESQRGASKSVDINISINSDGVTAKVEKQ